MTTCELCGHVDDQPAPEGIGAWEQVALLTLWLAVIVAGVVL